MIDARARTTTRHRWWPPALYPMVFPVAFVVVLWDDAAISLQSLVRPLGVAVTASIAIVIIAGVAAGDRRVGGIAATAILVGLVIDRPAASVLLALVAIIVVIAGRRGVDPAGRVTATVSTILRLVATIVLLATAISTISQPGSARSIQESFMAPPGPAVRPAAASGSPDIFVYLLDGYPGSTDSAQAPWFDAAAFPTALRQRGFTVHDDARTDYPITRLVLPTMFDMRHIGDISSLAAPYGPRPADDAQRLRLVLASSQGVAAIRAAGYDVVWVSSGWTHIDDHAVDRWIAAEGPDEFETALIQSTAVGTILEMVDPYGVADIVRTRIHAAFDTAATIAMEPHERPRFVFVHVPAPHPPVVFREDGSDEDVGALATWDYPTEADEPVDVHRRQVFENVEAVDDLALDGIDRLLAATPEPPVVIVFSDHGTDVGLDPDDMTDRDIDRRTSSILATLTPGHPDLFGDPTTPVNIIGSLTNAYLGTDVPRQADQTYVYDGSVLNVRPVEVEPGD